MAVSLGPRGLPRSCPSDSSWNVETRLVAPAVTVEGPQDSYAKIQMASFYLDICLYF